MSAIMFGARLRRLLPTLTLLAASAAALLALTGQPAGMPGAALGLILVAFAPGYSLLRAFGPMSGPPARDLFLCVVLSLALAVVVIGAAAAFGVSLAGPWPLVGLWLVTALLAAAGAVRARPRQPGVAGEVSAAGGGGLEVSAGEVLASGGVAAGGVAVPAAPRPRSTRAQRAVSLAGALIALVVGGWAASQVLAAAQPTGKPFTSLAIAHAPDPADGKIVAAVVVGSYEGGPTTYKLEVEAGGVLVGAWPGLHLSHGEHLSIQLPPLPPETQITARLYSGDTVELYRSVRLSAPATGAQP